MNISEYMNKHSLTDDDLDRIAEPYESGDYAHEPGEVFIGSYLDVVGKSVSRLYTTYGTLCGLRTMPRTVE